jgi:phage shock protein A
MDAMTDEELVQDLTKDYAEVMDGIVEMLDLKRSLEKDLATSDDQITSLKQKVQQPDVDAAALGGTLAQYRSTRAQVSEALEKVNDTLREMRISIEKLNDVLRRLPGGYKRDWQKYDRVDIRTLPF